MTFITEEARNIELMDREDKDFTKIVWRILNFFKYFLCLVQSEVKKIIFVKSS